MSEAVEQVDTQAPTKADGREPPYRLLNLSDVLAMPSPTWVVDGVIPGSGVAVIFGQPNAGKTFITLDMALHVAHGVEWFGRRTQQRPVVYVGLEGVGGIGNRLKGLMLARWPDLIVKKPALSNNDSEDMPMHFLLGESFRFALEDDQDTHRLIAAVSEMAIEKPLFIIDTLALAIAGNENDNEVMAAVARQANHLSAATNGTVILLHHPNKGNENDMRGGSALRGAVDAAILISGDKDKGRAWTMTKTRDGEVGTGGAFDLVPVTLDDASSDKSAVTTCAVRERLDRNPAVATRNEPTGANQKKLLDIMRAQFPNGCTEPQLVEAWRAKLPEDKRRRAKQDVKAALTKLVPNWLQRCADGSLKVA